MASHYVIIYFGPLRGGFARRMGLLAEALARKGTVSRIHSLPGLWRFLRSRQLRKGRTAVIVYSDLMVPLVALLRRIRPDLPVYYMVRGDQVTWAAHAGRAARARIASRLQKRMARLGCRFVFASEDLQVRFAERIGAIAWQRVLPNTLGCPLGESRAFDGRVAIVGDFGTVKNIEHVITALDGEFRVDLYGNTAVPKAWKRPWLHAHGTVEDLARRLGDSSLVVLASLSEGFPNVLLDALEAGCGVVAHRGFPFSRLPLGDRWRFDLPSGGQSTPPSRLGAAGPDGSLLPVLRNLRDTRANFRQENTELVELAESDWTARVLEVFESDECTERRERSYENRVLCA